MSEQPPTLVASAEPAGGFAALAQLAFGLSRATAVSGAGDQGPSRNSQRSLDPLELDLADPTQREFGDYTLLSRVGQGGMGIVYRAHQRSLDREVAIKLLAAGPWASPGFIERFRQEAQSAARMQHPNIVTIHEIGEHDGLPFFSMRLVRGSSLAQHLHSERALAPARAAALMRSVAEAVDYAHRLGVLHLDIKPGNVLLDEGGEALVADFGLARRLEETLAGVGDEISGTPSYMAPEQVLAGGRLGVATDVYALGATLYEMLTGRPPFRGSSARETLEQVVSTAAPVPRTLDKRIPLDLQAICAKCMQKEADARYASARALAEDLGRYLEGREVQARRLNRTQRAWRLIRREPRLSALVALFLASLMTGLLATTVQWNRADANADDAREHLWGARAQAAESALADGDGFRGLQSMVANLAEMESAGRHLDADIERQRIGTLLANAPQLIDLIRLEKGTSISAVAISPDGSRFAVSAHRAENRRHVSLYDAASAKLLWTTGTDEHTRSTPFSGLPHAYLRFTPDGLTLLVGLMQQPVFAAPSMSDTLALAVADGRPLLPPDLGPDHADFSFSDDGRVALVRWLSDPSLRFPDRVQVYATQDWRPLGPRRAHAATQWMFTPDGSGLLATRDFARFELLDAQSFEPRWTLELSQAAPIHAWRFSADGDRLALGDLRGQVWLVDTGDGSRRSLATVPAATIRWLEFNEDASLLAALAEDGTIMAWEVASGLPRSAPILERIGNRLGRIRITDDLILRPVGSELRGWWLPPLAPFDNFAVPVAARISSQRMYWAHTFDLHAASRLLVVGEGDGIGLWRMPATALLAGRAPPLPAGTLHFDGRRIASVDGATLQVIDATTGVPMGPPLVHPEPLRLAEFSADASRLATIAGRTLRVFDAATLAAVGTPLVLPATPLRADLARGAAVMVVTTGGYDGASYRERIFVVDLVDGSLRDPGATLAGPPTEFELDPHGRYVIVSSGITEGPGGSIATVDLLGADHACVPARSDARTNGTPIAIADDGGSAWYQAELPERRMRLQRWDLETCRELAAMEYPAPIIATRLVALGDGVVAQSLAPDALSVVAADGSRRDIEGLAGLNLMHDFAVSRDGKRVAQATRNAVQITDLDRGERTSSLLAAPLPGHDAIGKLAFSPDGHRLLGRSVRGRWLQWNLPRTSLAVGELAELAATLESRSSTHAMDERRFAALRQRLRAADAGPPRARPDLDRPTPIALPMAPGASPDPRFRPLDLAAAINVPLNGNWPLRAPTGGDAATLAPGPQRFDGIDFRIDGGVQLSGGGPALAIHPLQPLSASIAVPGIRATRVHLLLMQRIPTRRSGAPRRVAEVILTGADGRRHTLPVMRLPDAPEMLELTQSSARIGWIGVASSSVRGGAASSSHASGIVPLISLDVPADVGVIRGLQLGIGNGQMEAPLFYAVTLETASTMEAAHAQ